MIKRTLLAIFIAFVETIGVTAVWSASSDGRDDETDANVLEDSGSPAGNVDENGEVQVKKKGGNKVVRAITAPFKAFGRLFKRGDDNKLRRMTEEDAEKFASVGVARVEDSRTPAANKLDAQASAKDHLAAGRDYLMYGRLNESIIHLFNTLSTDPK